MAEPKSTSIKIGSTVSLHALYEGVERILGDVIPEKTEIIAVGLSGGPDSMALTWILNEWARRNNVEIHALYVDHGLRKESKKEAKKLEHYLQGLDCVRYVSLVRDVVKSDKDSRIQEKARGDRYKLLVNYCFEQDIQHLCLAHHQNDQAETFLFRLAKGSGLDGLSSMRVEQDYDAGKLGKFKLIRPLLWAQKTELVKFCRTYKAPYFEDSSNKNEKFARVRLRQSAEILEEEGLSAKRLSVTASRLERARKALDIYAQNLFDEAWKDVKDNRIVFDFDIARKCPSETRLRLLQMVIGRLSPTLYGPRMEKLEALEQRVFDSPDFKKATLGGCVFVLDRGRNSLIIEREL